MCNKVPGIEDLVFAVTTSPDGLWPNQLSHTGANDFMVTVER